MKNIIYLSLLSFCFYACDNSSFDLSPKTKVGESLELFETESGIETYTNSFYGYISSGVILDDFTSDNCEHIGNPPAIRRAIYTIPNALGSGGWSWTQLRNINYFIDKCNQSSVVEDVKNMHLGLAKFFRAKFYFEKVKTFGDVPWYSYALSTDDNDNIFKARDPRVMIMDSVLNDLDEAIKYLPKSKYKNKISKWSALAYKSRVCLYEGTWRKYHKEANLPDADKFLNECVNASRELMESDTYSLFSTGNPSSDYASMFQADEANLTEVILARSSAPGSFFYYTPNFTSTSNGNYGATYSLIEDYPMADGTSFVERYPDKKIREELSFYKEMKDRDPRLAQSIVYPGYIRIGTNNIAVNDFAENRTGYQITKRVGPPSEDQGGDTRDVIIIRYPEVLLNYAEAKAVLGTLTQEDIDMTINRIRGRVGLSSRLLPLKTDETQLEMYKSTTDQNVLEIRRERRIELAFEGFRKDDIIRWNEGHLFRVVYKGIYIKGLRTLIDLDGDEKPDLYVLESGDEVPTDKIEGVQYFRLSDVNSLTEMEKGRLVPYNKIIRAFENWEYFNPIPTEELTLNPKLEQNKGWN